MCVRDWQSKKNPCGLNSPLDQVSHVHQNKTKQTLFLISSDCPVDSRLEQSLSIDVEQVFSLSLFPFIIMYIESIVGRRHWFFSFSPFFCVFRGPPKPFFSFVAAEREKTREEETQVIYKTLLFSSLSPLSFFFLCWKKWEEFLSYINTQPTRRRHPMAGYGSGSGTLHPPRHPTAQQWRPFFPPPPNFLSFSPRVAACCCCSLPFFSFQREKEGTTGGEKKNIQPTKNEGWENDASDAALP